MGIVASRAVVFECTTHYGTEYRVQSTVQSTVQNKFRTGHSTYMHTQSSSTNLPRRCDIEYKRSLAAHKETE